MDCRYHSHPIFAPKPSQKDNENQRNYQALFRCDRTRLEPFIGAIVGPYDMQLPTQVHHYAVYTTHSGLAAAASRQEQSALQQACKLSYICRADSIPITCLLLV